MSSPANVVTTPAVGPSALQQSPAAIQDTQDNGTGPFAALLDAAASSPEPATAQPVPSRLAAGQPAAQFGFASQRNAGTATATQTPTQNTTAPAATTKSANATGVAAANGNGAPNQNPGQSASVLQTGAPSPTDPAAGNGTAPAALAGQLTQAVDEPATTPAPGSTTKARSGEDDQDDDATTDGAATANGQSQPVAAAIATAAPASADATASGTVAVDGLAGANARPALPFADTDGASPGEEAANAAPMSNDGGASTPQVARNAAFAQSAKDAAFLADAKAATPAPDATAAQQTKPATPGPNAKAGATAKQASATNGAAPAADAGNTDPASGALWNATAAPHSQTQADGDAVILGQSGGATTAHLDALTASDTSSANAAGLNGAKAATDALPNFGFAAANQVASTATAAAAATPANAALNAVPIAGLPVVIAARAQAGSNQFDIRLDPPELGRIDVRLDVDRNGQVTSHVTVDRPDTLQLLQSQQPQLERALEQAGLKTADNGLQFTLRDQSLAGQNGGSGDNGSGGNQTGTAQLVIPDADLPAIQTTQIYSRFGRGSGIDIRV